MHRSSSRIVIGLERISRLVVAITSESTPSQGAAAAWKWDASSGTCPACGQSAYDPLFHATDSLYRTTDQSFLLVRCTRCLLIRLTPPIPSDQLPHYYPSTYWFVPDVFSSFETAYRKFVLRGHIAFTAQAYSHAGSAGLLLDVGCGGGLLLAMLRNHLPARASLLGMDVSHGAVASAAKVNHVTALCGSLDTSPLREGSCSVVTMFHVLEHLPDPVKHLKAARLLLRPGGRLVVQVPNAACWQFRLFGPRWNGIDVPRHLINYRAQDVTALLAACGFKVQRIAHFNLRDNPAGFATSLAPALDPMARRLTGAKETPLRRFCKNILYLALTVAAVPFALAEAAFRRGSSVMIEASRD